MDTEGFLLVFLGIKSESYTCVILVLTSFSLL